MGLANYRWALGDAGFREALTNSLLWLAVAPTLTVLVGLTLAGLVRGAGLLGRLVQAVVLLPTGISFVGAAVIWKFILEYRPEGAAQTGLLNALVTAAGLPPQTWLTLPTFNSLCLMAIFVWGQAGFAMVILSAALARLPRQLTEAARLDGLTERAIFWRIEVPQIAGAIIMVWTALALIVLKLFDLVHALTNGQWGSAVLADNMVEWLVRGGGHFGRGAVLALALVAIGLPVLLLARQAQRRWGRLA
ncbi:MAG: sugar ABC transporter permease [Paracoccaceae bacterium]